jgi:hypothetical protein
MSPTLVTTPGWMVKSATLMELFNIQNGPASPGELYG